MIDYVQRDDNNTVYSGNFVMILLNVYNIERELEIDYIVLENKTQKSILHLIPTQTFRKLVVNVSTYDFAVMVQDQ